MWVYIGIVHLRAEPTEARGIQSFLIWSQQAVVSHLRTVILTQVLWKSKTQT